MELLKEYGVLNSVPYLVRAQQKYSAHLFHVFCARPIFTLHFPLSFMMEYSSCENTCIDLKPCSGNISLLGIAKPLKSELLG